jgi:hypothetical protein
MLSPSVYLADLVRVERPELILELLLIEGLIDNRERARLVL